MTYCMIKIASSRKSPARVFSGLGKSELSLCNLMILLGLLVGPGGLEPPTKGL